MFDLCPRILVGVHTWPGDNYSSRRKEYIIRIHLFIHTLCMYTHTHTHEIKNVNSTPGRRFFRITSSSYKRCLQKWIAVGRDATRDSFRFIKFRAEAVSSCVPCWKLWRRWRGRRVVFCGLLRSMTRFRSVHDVAHLSRGRFIPGASLFKRPACHNL